MVEQVRVSNAPVNVNRFLKASMMERYMLKLRGPRGKQRGAYSPPVPEGLFHDEEGPVLFGDTNSIPFKYIELVGGVKTVKWAEDTPTIRLTAKLAEESRVRQFFALSDPEPDDHEIEKEKRERQHGLRMAGVWLDDGAVQLLTKLEEESSVTWESLPESVGSDSWEDAVRAALLLSCAGLCEAGRRRLRLSEYGVRLLASDWWQGVRAEYAG